MKLETQTPFEVLAEVSRGPCPDEDLLDSMVESVHFGAVAATDENGVLLYSLGDAGHRTFIRSAAKPFQVLPLIESGGVERFGFTPKECAVMCASHNGEPAHVEAVQGILHKIGLEAGRLQCGVHPPNHGPTANALLRDGKEFSVLHNNCSGKHAGMLAACVHLGFPVDNYLDFDHPLQVEIRKRIETHSGEAGIFCGTDGCSAPVFFLQLQSMARMFARLAAQRDPALSRSFEMMRAEPFLIGGTDRFDTDLMSNSGVVAKVGGEGIECVGIPATVGRSAMGIAVKIADGNFRALYPVVIELLRHFQVLDDSQLGKLAYYQNTPLRNHRKKHIGFVRSAIRF